MEGARINIQFAEGDTCEKTTSRHLSFDADTRPAGKHGSYLRLYGSYYRIPSGGRVEICAEVQ